MKKINEGGIDGHSAKWANSNRRASSHEAGQGSRGSRNQGTGLAGRANTVASDEVDTSQMSNADKLKYFKELGILGAPEAQPKPFTMNNFVSELGEVFKGRPQYLQAITKELHGLNRDALKYAAEEAWNALQRIQTKTKEPRDIAEYILKSIRQSKM